MITAVIRGGLGNQLFQYASAYALSKKLRQQLTLDTSFYHSESKRAYRLDQLHLSNHFVTNGETDNLLIRCYKNRYINGVIRRMQMNTLPITNGIYLVDKAGRFTPSFFDVEAENIFMNGYFQSEEYFREYRGEILKQFTPSYEPEKEYLKLVTEIQNCESVSIHVRHGDFSNRHKTGYHYVLNADYYIRAIDTIREHVAKPKFYFFSDDMDWVRKNLPSSEEFEFISLNTHNGDIDELMLMSKCQHNITANSTFSWWGAWLNTNKRSVKITPDKQYGDPKMIPASWIKIVV
ncbi:MAG: alpha-1,2-fucosyltransferase [Erysipelotrichaceae bacterium]|nr:alpha-1,2-fucosyltransferase [Erysipelotrichaceae bacterium]